MCNIIESLVLMYFKYISFYFFFVYVNISKFLIHAFALAINSFYIAILKGCRYLWFKLVPIIVENVLKVDIRGIFIPTLISL